jgi:Nucleotidyl transferase AbiEii toxin, Type IV TA system
MFYLDLFGALARHRVRYVVVGGLALNLHGVERATMDVDLALALDPLNVEAAIDAFEELGLVPVAPVKIDEARDPETLRRWRRDKNMVAFGLRPAKGAGPTVDFLIEPVVPFATLAGNALAKAIGEITIPIASIDDLIALKRAAGRAIDLADIEALGRLRQLGLDH